MKGIEEECPVQETRRFYKTIFKVEVLSEEAVPEDIDLDALYYEIDQGEYVGIVHKQSEVEVTPKQMARLLYAFGSEPNTFQLDDQGKYIEG